MQTAKRAPAPAPVEQIGGPVAGGAFHAKAAYVRPALGFYRVIAPRNGGQPPLVLLEPTLEKAIRAAQQENAARGISAPVEVIR
jgi:hypothetical protein